MADRRTQSYAAVPPVEPCTELLQHEEREARWFSATTSRFDAFKQQIADAVRGYFAGGDEVADRLLRTQVFNLPDVVETDPDFEPELPPSPTFWPRDEPKDKPR